MMFNLTIYYDRLCIYEKSWILLQISQVNK